MKNAVAKQQSLPASLLGYGIAQFNADLKGLVILDTNVPINDSGSFERLMKGGEKGVVLPWISLGELDSLKDKDNISSQVMRSIRKINQLQHERNPNFYIAQGKMSDWTDLNPDNPDHHIIALCLTLRKQHPQMPMTLISNDAMVHTVGMRFSINVEEYKANQVDRVDFQQPLPRICVDELLQLPVGNDYRIVSEHADRVPVNGGAVIYSRDGSIEFAAIRKNHHFVPIQSDIRSMGISSFSIDRQPNWAQMVALAQLLDPSISLVTLHGEAGTGKTLLSIAAALNQLKIEERSEAEEAKHPEKGKKHLSAAGSNVIAPQLLGAGCNDASRRRYRKVYLARPHVHLSNRDTMGFLPGDINVKSVPWLAPLYDNIEFIESRNDANRKLLEQIRGQDIPCLEVLPLSFIRGRTLAGAIVVVDEAQNLTRAEMKTIVTRAGEGTKIVLVGDVDQIDIPWIDKRSSGLTHVTVKMAGLDYFANTFLDKSVRSVMAKDAAELL